MRIVFKLSSSSTDEILEIIGAYYCEEGFALFEPIDDFSTVKVQIDKYAFHTILNKLLNYGYADLTFYSQTTEYYNQ